MLSMIYDALVLGGGFYGCKVALALRGLGLKVLLLEPHTLLSGATAANQGRVHGGYHYPRFRATALSAIKYYRRFLADHAPAIDANCQHWYAIAAGSKTSPAEFEQVMGEIGAPLEQMPVPAMFRKELIQSVYRVEEVTFNMSKLLLFVHDQLRITGVEREHSHGRIIGVDGDHVLVSTDSRTVKAGYAFNCTYGAIDEVHPIRTKLKKEFTEVAMVKVGHPQLSKTDITIMDGPFWSLMRFPSSDCHALTHVTYTPHCEWYPPAARPACSEQSAFPQMIADVDRFIPEASSDIEYLGSRYATRVVLANHEEDDGRPILWEYSKESPRIISILGSKFNSIYDAIKKIESGEWVRGQGKTGVLPVGGRALVGYTGFVGSNLRGVGRFTDLANRTRPLDPGHYDLIVCAAPSGAKWKANRFPEIDRAEIAGLRNMLSACTADEFILISTVDTLLPESGAYGDHRREFESWCALTYADLKIIRVPALFGPGLKKNALHDLLADPVGEHAINPESTYQWYPVSRLWKDVEAARTRGDRDVNLVTPPIKMSWFRQLFPRASFSAGAPRVSYHVESSIGFVASEEEIKTELKAFVEQSWGTT